LLLLNKTNKTNINCINRLENELGNEEKKEKTFNELCGAAFTGVGDGKTEKNIIGKSLSSHRCVSLRKKKKRTPSMGTFVSSLMMSM